MKRSKRDSGSGHGFLVAAAVALGIYIGHAMGGRMANQLMQTGIDTAVAAALQSVTSSVVPALAIHATVAIACALMIPLTTVLCIMHYERKQIDYISTNKSPSTTGRRRGKRRRRRGRAPGSGRAVCASAARLPARDTVLPRLASHPENIELTQQTKRDHSTHNSKPRTQARQRRHLEGQPQRRQRPTKRQDRG